MTLFADRRRVAWLAASAAAGLIAGQLVMYPADFWRAFLALAVVPGALQGLVLWRSEPLVFVRWVVATTVGVVCTFALTIGLAWLVGLVAVFVERLLTGIQFSSSGAPSFFGWVLFFAAFFIGGAGLGGLQVAAFPRGQRRVRWLFATMLGGVALVPIAMALVGLTLDPPLGLPFQLAGLIGGSLYGLVTALAIPPRAEP